MSMSASELLFGGIRNSIIDLRALHAELNRSTDQTSENLQTANSRSGAQTTNTLTQSLTENQNGSNTVNETITIPPPTPPAAGVPVKFQQNFNYIERLNHQANVFDLIDRGKAEASQVQRAGQEAFTGGAAATGTNSAAFNTLTQTAVNMQTLDAANLNTNFSAVTGTLPLVVARNREIIVTADRNTTEGISNLTQLQGTAPEQSGSVGAREVLKSALTASHNDRGCRSRYRPQQPAGRDRYVPTGYRHHRHFRYEQERCSHHAGDIPLRQYKLRGH